MLLNNISLLFSMIRNIRSERINRDMIGHSISRRIGPVTRDDFQSYIEATLDNPLKYSGETTHAPPFYISRPLYPLFKYYLTHKKLGLNLLRLVHAEQSIEWFDHIYEGVIFDVEMKIADITESSAGEIINLETTGRVEGKKIAKANTFFLVRSRKKKTKAGKGKTSEEEYKEEIFRKTIRTVENQSIKYARVSGDTNFIHTNRFLAKLAGLPGIIMHGVCIGAMTVNTLLEEILNGDMKKMKSVSMRFANPVFPGEEIILIGYKSDEKNRILFEAVNRRGKPVLKNGEFLISG